MRICDNGMFRDATPEEMNDMKIDIPRATKPLKKGEYFYLDGLLCRAKTSISNGAVLTLNTNYQITSIENELAELNS